MATGYSGPVGKPVILHREFVEGGLRFFAGLVDEIQDKLENQRATK